MRTRALCVALIALAASSGIKGQERSGALFEVPLPGGLQRALAAIDDRTPADRGQFLLEFIRRAHQGPARTDARGETLRRLIAHLERSTVDKLAARNVDTLPLPLPPALWIDAVFGGRATPDGLLLAILQSREAALLYEALLSLDDETRSWLATQPDLVRDLASRHAAAFLIASPGLQIAADVVRVPGGDRAVPVWEALAGRPVNDPAGFVRNLVSEREGRLAYFYGAAGQLTLGQVAALMNLDVPDVPSRIAAGQLLQKSFERVAAAWHIEDQPFWRPAVDPALLVADLAAYTGDKPAVPGTRGFWSEVFAGVDRLASGRTSGTTESPAASDSKPADLPWLCEQVFRMVPTWRRRYSVVLFAARTVKQIEPGNEPAAIDALRAAAGYPALVASLERAGLTDAASFAAAARRASQLSTIGDHSRAQRALAQFQGALVLITRAADRGSVPVSSLADLVSSLAAVPPGDRGDYEGRLLRWLEDTLLVPSRAADPIGNAPREPAGDTEETPDDGAERGLLQILAGPAAVAPRFVEWEGTRYRVDLVSPEALRIEKLLGEDAPPFVSVARSVNRIADALERNGLTARSLRDHSEALARAARTAGLQDALRWKGTSVRARSRKAVAALERAAGNSDVAAAQRLAPELRLLVDDLLARGLLQLTYAAALGQPERIPVSADAAASRHDFGLTSSGRSRTSPWQLPLKGADTLKGWGVMGSMLGLDVTLAEFAVIRLSTKPPLQRPTLNDEDRRVLTSAVALVQSITLADADRDAIAAAIQKGRARLAAVRTHDDAIALADEIRLSGARRSLLAWILAYEPARVAAFLSPSELLWLGRDGTPLPPAMHAWGAPGEPRVGCLCLQLIDRRPWEILAGRWHSGIFASGFPDLNLRLAELLAELQMPASLLGPMLASATIDFIDGATSRDNDDRRSLVEFVQALRKDKVEQYLATLTTDGPLVPAGEGSDRKLPATASMEGRR